ncbi:MAG: glycerate kinase [Flavobacterium sp.]|nr:MAG: glycerate kinase [Flavobacterium sp.]
MNVLLIPDAFKDSLSSSEVASAMRRGVLAEHPDANIFHITASDGGEGFLESVRQYLPNAEVIVCKTVDPLGRPLEASYLIDRDNNVAYIELAKASGLELLKPEDRNPLFTSTKGTGVQIADAIRRGMKTIYLGIGGSATNDAATGIVSALGFKFSDESGDLLDPCGNMLGEVSAIEKPVSLPEDLKFYAINDVLNPLYGPEGAAFTYAKQKGASTAEIKLLDAGLQNISEVIRSTYGMDHSDVPGSGAAGGTAYGLKAFLNAEYISGVSFLLKLAKFNELVDSEGIDLILTGEGCIDSQTAYGKLVSGVANEARLHNIPVMAVCGKLNLNKDEVRKLGMFAADEIYRPDQPEGYSYSHAASLISKRTVELLSQL